MSQCRTLQYLSLIAIAFSCSGASCFRWTREPTPTTPVMFASTPELGEVLQKINLNTLAVRQLEADDVRIAASGAPTLRAKLALEMPRKLRLRADFLMARELDIGSNDEVFWVFSKTGNGALFFSRHDEFARSPAQQILPVNPQWLMDALGLVTFDPAAQHEGPYDHGPEQMEVRSHLLTPGGEQITKFTIIHRTYGWVLEQQIRDSSQRTLASAQARKHRYYPEVGATLPEIVDVQLAPGQPSQLAFQIDVGTYRINQMHSPAADLWVMPTMEGYPHINLADPRWYHNIQPAHSNQPAHSASAYQPEYSPENRTSYRQQYRGYSR